MRMSLCNEVVRHLPFPQQCALARELGYDGLEIAPFTLGDEPHRLSPARIADLRSIALGEGIGFTGLHWLLMKPENLSITSRDALVRQRTVDVMRSLIDLCAELGGQYLVHGSPRQRELTPGHECEQRTFGAECFAAAGKHASAAGVIYCIEPLAPDETNFLTSVAEAGDLVREINIPALRTMIDCAAAMRGTDGDPAKLLSTWLPSGLVAHVHLNDPNRRGPGQGSLHFKPILQALRGNGYSGFLGIEPFIYEPDGPSSAARAIGYLRGCLE